MKTVEGIGEELSREEFQPLSVAQLVILVLDGSGSMTETGKTGIRKSDEVRNAVRGFVKRLKNSRFSKGFYINVEAFDTEIKAFFEGYRPVSDADEDSIPSPVELVGGKNTNITLALEKAYELAKKFKSDPNLIVDEDSRIGVILLLSDGMHNTGSSPEAIADEINSQFSFGHTAHEKPSAYKEIFRVKIEII